MSDQVETDSEPAIEEPRRTRRQNLMHEARDIAKTVLYALIIAFVIRIFAFEPFNIPSGSMKPTLLVGDYLFVSKTSYGYSKHSLPYSPPVFSGRVWEDTPKVGDVVVFKTPTDNSTDFIKRVIGLPGDRIQMVNGLLHINGKPAPRRRDGEFVTRNEFGTLQRIPRFVQTLPNGVEHHILEAHGDSGGADNTKVYTVPDGHFFAMGDNRDNSSDSRVFGFIPMENLVGRAEFLFFSIEDAYPWQLWTWFTNVRFSRIFDAVE